MIGGEASRGVRAPIALAVVAVVAGCSGAAPRTTSESVEGIRSDSPESAAHVTTDAPHEGIRTPEQPPGSAPTALESPWFEDVTAASGIDFVHESGATGRYLMPEAMVGGVALVDVDGDGDLDVYFVQAGDVTAPEASRPPNRLYRNDGGWRFTDITEGSGADDRGYGSGVAVGDYDDDGDPDLYVTNLGRNTLLRNDGGGRFTDVTDEAGVGDTGWSSSAAFLDFDLDGDLDLYVVNFIEWSPESDIACRTAAGLRDYCGPTSYDSPARDRLYRNDGGGRFADVTAESGIAAGGGNGLGIVVVDFDRDGDPDIFVANDGLPDELWVNDGAGRFVDRAPLLGVAVDEGGRARAGMGTDAADLDGDGDEEILVVNLVGETDGLYVNEIHHFVEATGRMGIAVASLPYTRFGTGFHDFDADGRLDLFMAAGRVRWQSDVHDERDPFAEPNLLFRGVEAGFERVPPVAEGSPRAVATSRGAAFGDLDQDGAVDVVVVNRDAPPSILRNIAPRRGRWLRVRALEPSGRDSLGAEVAVSAGGREIVRTIRSAYSYCSASEPAAHFGLGPDAVVDEITIRWPGGAVERFDPPRTLDASVDLRRGEG